MIDKDICRYWESIAEELEAAKSRVRNLIGSAHWLTDGTHKEILLRSVLRRHLPEELSVCTGFVYKNAEISSQIDILVIRKSGYTLFKEGDLVIVTPHAVKAIIEVKTTLDGPSKMKEVLAKLARNTEVAEQELVQDRGQIWSGLFIYEQDANDEEKQRQILHFVIDMVSSLTRNLGSSDFQTLNKPILSGMVKPQFQINRGDKGAEKIANSA